VAKTIKVDVTVDTSDVDKAQEDINKLQKSAGTISTKIDVDSSELKDAEEEIDDVKKNSKIEVKFNADTGEVDILSDKTLKLSQQAKVLKDALANVPQGTEEYIAINQKLGDIGDQMAVINVKSRELFGTISLLPGPFGEVANTVEGTIDTFKQLDAISLKDVKANIAAFGDDIKGVFATIGKLTGITKVYTTLNNALAQSFVKVGVGEAAAATGARVFAGALTATGIGLLVVGVGLLAQKFYELATAEDAATIKARQVLEQQQKLSKYYDEEIARANAQTELDALRAKSAGKTEDEIVAIKRKGLEDVTNIASEQYKKALDAFTLINKLFDTNRLTDAERKKRLAELTEDQKKQLQDATDAFDKANSNFTKASNDLDKFNIESDIDREERRKNKQKETNENIKKSLEERKKLIEDYYARLKEIDARESAAVGVDIGATRSMLDDRLKEELAIEDAYEEKRKTLLRANITDFTNIERERFATLFEVRKNYAQKDLEKTLSDLNNRFEQEKFLLDKKLADGLMTEIDYNNQLLELEKTNNDAILAETEKFYADLQKSLDDAFESGLITQSYYDSQTLSLTQALNDKKIEIYQTANGLILKGVESTNKAIEDQFEKSMKSYDDKLKLLELKGQILNKNGKRWFDNAREILELSLAKELAILEKSKGDELKLVGDNEEKRSVVIKQYEELVTATTQKYSQDRKDIKQQEIAAYGEVASALINSFGAVTSAIASGYDEEAKTSKEAFEKRKKLQKATAIMSAASGIINILTQPSTLPSPFDFIVKGINAAALGIATKVQIDNINKTEFESQSGGSGGSNQLSFSQPSAPTPSIGVSQNQTGVIANIVDKAVQRDNSRDRPLRAYVIQNDIRTEEQLNRRLRTAARLG
jgi:hypothetical protein